jgi:putative ABC transport system permease protein
MFKAVGMPLAAKRWFNDEDRRGPRPKVAIVNRAFAAKVMQGPAVGRVIRLAGKDQNDSSSTEVTIVGVVENFGEPRNERNGPDWFVYTPMPLGPEAARVLYVRSHETIDDSLSAAVLKAVHEVDPRVPIGTIGSLDQLNYQSLPEAQLAQGAKAFGFVALVLAAFGIYGVMSYFVSQRSREIAIRIALGAEEKGILGMVVKQSMTLASVGAIVGTILATIASLALQVINRAPLGIHGGAFAGAAFLLLAVMFLASVFPAVRASRIDPIENLRQS